MAEFEARQSKASTIEPTHLLLGLCKSVDLDLPALVSENSPDRDDVLEELLREVRRLRTIFRIVGMDARMFRRALRGISCGSRNSPSESKHLRRSKAAKRVFSDAEHIALLSNCIVFPVHLLYAVTLIEDQMRDELMKEFGVELKRLRQIAKREAMFAPSGTPPSPTLN